MTTFPPGKIAVPVDDVDSLSRLILPVRYRISLSILKVLA